jgi:hypothetical protein
LLALLAMLVIPGAASATLTPSLTLTPSALPAGATHALGFDLMFSPSLGDSPTNLNLSLPAGLLVNVNLDGGACVTSATPVAGCELARGTATTTFLTPQPVSVWLVKSPSPIDLAGAALVAGYSPSDPVEVIGTVALRTTPDVGLDLSFGSLPGGVNAFRELQLTLSGVRAPTSCPSPPASLGASASSSEVASAQTATAPLTITGCTSLAYAPTLAATVARDAGDAGAAFMATITGAAMESATKDIEVHVPASVLPDQNTALRCLLGTSCTIGVASASSPLLPSSALSHGIVNLGGSVLGPTLTVGFPLPYPVSLTGTVGTSGEGLSFSGIPDLPLTSLSVEIGAGSNVRIFTTTCATGSLSAKLTPWSGAPAQTGSTPITFGGSCRAAPTASGGPRVTGASLRGVVKRAPRLAFTVDEGTPAVPIKRIALTLPAGLALASTQPGIAIRSAHGRKLKFTAAASHGRITITLRTASAKFAVAVAAPAVAVSAALARRVEGQLRRKEVTSLHLAVKLTDSAKRTTGLALGLKPKS